MTNVEWISSSYSKNQELDTMSDYLKIQFWNTELNYFLNEKYWIIVWVKMILFFISLHHKTLPLLNKCAVSCWLSTVKKTRNGGSFKISLVHRMTSTNIKMYEVNLWQCNQSTWKSRNAQCTKYPKNGSNTYFKTWLFHCSKCTKFWNLGLIHF